MRVQAALVGEGLTIVIVLLLAKAKRREGDDVVGGSIDIVDASTSGGGKAEVLVDDWQRVGPVAPGGVVDGGVEVMVVASPLGFA